MIKPGRSGLPIFRTRLHILARDHYHHHQVSSGGGREGFRGRRATKGYVEKGQMLVHQVACRGSLNQRSLLLLCCDRSHRTIMVSVVCLCGEWCCFMGNRVMMVHAGCRRTRALTGPNDMTLHSYNDELNVSAYYLRTHREYQNLTPLLSSHCAFRRRQTQDRPTWVVFR